jgi:phosphoribosylaminoimidazole carboxylase PurE protein
MKNADVAVIMGSKSDLKVARETEKILKDFNIKYDMKVLSAHRAPDASSKFAKEAVKNNIKVIIALAGKAAHLAGVVASHTTIPVIGVPMDTKDLKGIDSLFSTVQMPTGVPVACMSIGETGAKNAAYFAIQILSLHDESLREKLEKHNKDQAQAILKTKI